MAKVTTYRLNLQDFKSEKSNLQNLVTNFNLLNDEVVSAFNGNITVGDNINGRVFTATFKTSANYSTGTFVPISFQFNAGTRPQSVTIGQIECTVPLEPILVATSLQWQYNNSVSPNQVTVTYVAGLKNSQTYQITVIAS